MRTAPSVVEQLTNRLVRRPENAKYNTILSIDGGGIRGIIPNMVLIRLESCIKDHLFEHRDTLIPEPLRNSVASVDDFDIDLTDYFDLVAGTSIGSVVATYVAARGKGSESIVNDPSIIRRYGPLRPGSMAAVRVVFHEFGRVIFPPRGAFSRVTRFFRSLYSSDGLENSLERGFGETTMADLDTGLLVTSYNLRHNAACSFLRGARQDRRLFTVRTALRECPRQSASDGAGEIHSAEHSKHAQPAFSSDLEITEGTNYRLRDIALASSSAPTYFPPAQIAPVNGGETITAIDGGVVANNPTLQALTYAPTTFPNPEPENFAILSLGCGSYDPQESIHENPGILWWFRSGHLLDAFQNGTSEYIQAVIDFWLYRNVGLQYGQYTRIQKSAGGDAELARLFANVDNVDALEDLERLGEELAEESDKYLRNFVRDFLFAT